MADLEKSKAVVMDLKRSDPEGHRAILEACQIFGARCVRAERLDDEKEVKPC